MSCPWNATEVVALQDFCEAVRPCTWVLQPHATASAVALLAVAGVIAWWGQRQRQPALQLLTLSCLTMGLGTMLQHASGTHWAMLVDHAGMQTANVALLLMVSRRATHASWQRLLVLGLALWVLAFALTVSAEPMRRAIFIGGAVPSTVLELALVWRDRHRVHHRWLYTGWALFALAIVAWWLDQHPGVCRPHSPWQLHAAWHALCAAAMGAWGAHYATFPELRPQST